MNVEAPPRRPLPRRDLILLPLISLLTALLMAVLAEYVARHVWVEKETDDCALGGRHKAGCVMLMKNIEGPWVRYQTNDCGYRGQGSCGPKPPGTLRLAIVGTSIAYGLHVSYDKYFVNLAAPELSRIWRHPIDVQNMGDIAPLWLTSDDSLKEMAALKPDAVFLVIAPFDLNRTDPDFDADRNVLAKPAAPHEAGWTWTDMRLALRESRVLFMAQHFMLNNEKFFLRAFEDYADPFDVSRVPTPPVVEKRFQQIDTRIAHVADYAHRAGAQCFLIALPNRVECALISKKIHLPHMDAYIFSRRMEALALKHGIAYIDMIPDIEKTPNAEKLFYSVDGHPEAGANVLMAHAIVEYFRPRGDLCPPTSELQAKY